MRSAVASRLALGVLLAFVAAGCARKMPPTGGPRDVAPPELLSIEPDSGATGVDTSAVLRLVFSEPMDRASVETGLLVAPGVRGGRFSWSGGRTVTFSPERPLRAGTVHTLLLVAGVRDMRGNVVDRPFAAHFTTGTAFGAGSIEGRVEGRGVAPEGVYLWAYREDRGRRPDSTALDMDALARARDGGLFRFVGLDVPGTYRLYAFVDRSRNRTFEPASDLLVRSESLLVLTADAPAARDIRVLAIDPEALARVEGAVVDSLSPGTAPLRVEVRGIPLDPVSAADRAPVIILDVRERGFAGNLRAGRWRLTAFRDLDDDRTLTPSEPRSQTVEIDLEPAGRAADITLVLAASP